MACEIKGCDRTATHDVCEIDADDGICVCREHGEQCIASGRYEGCCRGCGQLDCICDNYDPTQSWRE
jgi:hypothetical protein